MLNAIIFERPFPGNVIQNICMDKEYDFPSIENWLKIMYLQHIYGAVGKKT